MTDSWEIIVLYLTKDGLNSPFVLPDEWEPIKIETDRNYHGSVEIFCRRNRPR